MRTLRKFSAYARILSRATRNRTDLVKFLWRRPFIAAAVQAYEGATLFSSCVPTDLKLLAQTKAAARVGCPF